MTVYRFIVKLWLKLEVNIRLILTKVGTTWMKIIQQDLKSNSFSLNEAIYVVQTCALWRLMSTIVATHS